MTGSKVLRFSAFSAPPRENGSAVGVRKEALDRGAHAGRALRTDLAAVRLDEVLHDGEPEPRTARLARATGVDAVEALEDARQVLGGDAAPRVAHADPD